MEEKEEVKTTKFDTVGQQIVSLITTSVIAVVISIILTGLTVSFVPIKESFQFWFGSSIFLTFFSIFFVGSVHKVPAKNLFVLKFLGRRLNKWCAEGYWGLLFPFILTGQLTQVKRITFGKKEGGEYSPVRCQTRDNAEVAVLWSMQSEIIDPVRWFNTADQMEAVENKFEGQMRMTINMFNVGDINQLKGVIAGVFNGKTYAVQRVFDGYLLKDRSQSIIFVETTDVDDDGKIYKLSDSEIAKRIRDKARGVEPIINRIQEGEDGTFNNDVFDPCSEEYVNEDSFEKLPLGTFEYRGLTDEAESVGLSIEKPVIKDIDPPASIKEAGAEAEKERLQKEAREEENKAHMRIAIELMGKDYKASRENWTADDWDRFKEFMTMVRVQEGTSKEAVIRHIGSMANGTGDAFVAASMLKD